MRADTDMRRSQGSDIAPISYLAFLGHDLGCWSPLAAIEHEEGELSFTECGLAFTLGVRTSHANLDPIRGQLFNRPSARFRATVLDPILGRGLGLVPWAFLHPLSLHARRVLRDRPAGA